jgi:hypothetical protein
MRCDWLSTQPVKWEGNLSLNWLAILAAAASSFLLGGVWYALFAKGWQRAAGLADEQLRARNPALVFGGAFVLALVSAASFAIFLGADVDVGMGAAYGLTAGLCWVAASFGINYLFECKNIRLFLINGGYHTLQFTVIGAILGAWR